MAEETWAIVELMGHVRLAGRLSEEERFGAKMGRLDIPNGQGCTGISASWCPLHGDCKCPEDERGEPISADGNGFGRNHPDCPLHAPSSKHGEEHDEKFVTQYFGGGSVYRITIVSEAVARDDAKRRSHAPVQPWDYPKQLTGPPRGDDGDDDDDVPY